MMRADSQEEYLAFGRRFAEAVLTAAQNRGCSGVDILVSIHGGWMYFDGGTEILEMGAVALTPDATRHHLETGAPWTDEDVIEHFPAPDAKPKAP